MVDYCLTMLLQNRLAIFWWTGPSLTVDEDSSIACRIKKLVVKGNSKLISNMCSVKIGMASWRVFSSKAVRTWGDRASSLGLPAVSYNLSISRRGTFALSM